MVLIVLQLVIIYPNPAIASTSSRSGSSGGSATTKDGQPIRHADSISSVLESRSYLRSLSSSSSSRTMTATASYHHLDRRIRSRRLFLEDGEEDEEDEDNHTTETIDHGIDDNNIDDDRISITISGSNGATNTHVLPKFPNGAIKILDDDTSDSDDDATSVTFAIYQKWIIGGKLSYINVQHHKKHDGIDNSDGSDSTTFVGMTGTQSENDEGGNEMTCDINVSVQSPTSDTDLYDQHALIYRDIPCYGGFTDITITIPINYDDNYIGNPKHACDRPLKKDMNHHAVSSNSATTSVEKEDVVGIHHERVHYDIELSCQPP